jgi:hypothetical protein
MTLELALEFGKLVFYVAATALASGWLTAGLTQVLKWKLISVPATKYPTVVAGILAFVLAIPAVYLTGIVEIAGWVSYVVIAVASLFVATQSYDTIKNAIIQIKTANEKE